MKDKTKAIVFDLKPCCKEVETGSLLQTSIMERAQVLQYRTEGGKLEYNIQNLPRCALDRIFQTIPRAS